MIYYLSIVETDKVIHTMETDIVTLVVEIESFGMSFDEFDKETGSPDGLQPKQADLNCVHALNKLYLHETRVVLGGRSIQKLVFIKIVLFYNVDVHVLELAMQTQVEITSVSTSYKQT
ncbi:hypothetical protein Tco_1257577 [Tanacetum coccineum]